MKKVNSKEVYKLYDSGLSDSQISKILNVTPECIAYWRRKKSLKWNKDPHCISKIPIDVYMKYYNDNITDKKVSKLLLKEHNISITEKGVQNFRKINNIPKVNKWKNIVLTKRQNSILIGTLLGDGSLFKVGPDNRTAICGDFTHSLAQEEYCLWKYNELKDICLLPRYYSIFDKRTKKEYKRCMVKFKSNPFTRKLYPRLYLNKVKRITSDILSEFTDLSLAVLFMDDGNNYKGYRFTIALNNFPREDVLLFSNFLKDKFNINSTVWKRKVLYIRRNSIKTFLNVISKHIHENLKYKIKCYQ